MWLVADSGSTKTEWRLFNKNGVQEKASSKGLNPIFLNKTSFENAVKESLPESWFAMVSKLWFYAAGVDTENMKSEAAKWLQSVFTKAEVWVESDLLAAAKAGCGSEEGIVAILGTGSNSALYNGSSIVEHIRPLGYILGDEGSGTALGKALLRHLLRDEFSKELSESLYAELGMSYDEILEHVYRSEWPNRFIASCTRVLHSHKSEKEISELINKVLEEFVNLLGRYSNASRLPINFVGSISCYFEENLSDIIKIKGLNMGKVIQSPAEELVKYHIKNH